MPKLGMEEIRKQQVIGAVLLLIADRGLSEITLDKVACSAGVSKGVVSYYFKSKDKLLLEACRFFLQAYLSEENFQFETTEKPPAAKGILLIIGKTVLEGLKTPFLKENEGHSNKDKTKMDLTLEQCKKIIMQIYSKVTVSDEYKKMMIQVYDKYLEAVIEVLNYGVAKGEFVIGDINKEALQIMALLDGLSIYSITGFQGTSADQMDTYSYYIDKL